VIHVMTAKAAPPKPRAARKKEFFKMPTFTIDTDQNITAYHTPEAAASSDAGLPRFSSQAELSKLAAEWPASRWIEVWNSIPGNQPVKKLGPPKKAAARVWTALQRLAQANAKMPASKPKKAARPAPTATKAKRAPKRTKKAGRAKAKKAAGGKKPRQGSSKKADVIALLRRAKGASLAEIQKLTGWQKHTVRGFISLLGSQAGLKVASRSEDGERTYRIAR
jgi:hypothetical protein